MYVQCPECHQTFHLSFRSSVAERLLKHDPEGRRPQELPRVFCWLCYREISGKPDESM